jgi:ABC-type nitrate/sulfonate/bicarbonate transport system permease component
MIGFAIGLMLGVPIGMFCWYRWGQKLAADANRIKSAL